jgi:hypothetical protein
MRRWVRLAALARPAKAPRQAAGPAALARLPEGSAELRAEEGSQAWAAVQRVLPDAGVVPRVAVGAQAAQQAVPGAAVAALRAEEVPQDVQQAAVEHVEEVPRAEEVLHAEGAPRAEAHLSAELLVFLRAQQAQPARERSARTAHVTAASRIARRRERS